VGTPAESGDEPSRSKMLHSTVLPTRIKASATLPKSRISALMGVSYRLRDLCWTRARTAASKRAKSVEP
jgi:hypothetical protein